MLLSSRQSWLKNRTRSPYRHSSPLSDLRDWLLEDRCLMSVSMPGNNTNLNKIFWHGGPPLTVSTNPPPNNSGFTNVTEAPPVKTIKITNNSTQTVYPIMRDANTGKFGSLWYDPQDFHDQEFRAYIGYHTSEGDFLGLRSGESITIQVPLVFWDGANVYFATDGADLLGQRGPNPFDYNPDALRYVVSEAADPFYNTQWVKSSTDHAGRIMFYRDTTSHTFAPDAPAQLTEHTIRDSFLLKFNIPDDSGQTFALINYDVSYVNDQILPIAMQATDVGIPNLPDARLGTLGKEDFGWLGANMSIDTLREKLQAFTSSDKSKHGLGDYFGGLGWPAYFNADPADIHIPGGDNIFMNGPFNGTRSKYDQNAWALTSGGTAPIEATANATPNGKVISLNFNTASERIAFFDTLKKMKAVGTVNVNISPSTIYAPALATVASFDESPTNPTVTVSTDIVSPNASFRFYRPVTDYASTTITNLWYSWAKYYTSLFTVPAPANVSGSITAGSNELHLSSVAGLEKGMMVNHTAINGIFAPDANGVGTVILSIDATNNIVKLSQIAEATSQGGATYSFTNPTGTAANGMTGILHGNDPTVQTFDLTFATDAQKAKAKKFAASVYTVMAAQSAVNPLFPNSNTMPGSMKIMHGVIGGDLTHIPHNNPKTTGVQIRDMIKSVLRGVHDFLDPTVSESDWYPDPADNKDGGGRPFNVYNLDPYVWFVHKVLVLSGYGFSLDDDAADVQAIGPKPTFQNGIRTDVQNLDIAIGGIKGLKNPLEWFGGVQWGTVTDTATIYQYSGDETQFQGKTIIKLTTPKVYWQVKNDNLPNALVGAYVSGPGIDKPTRLAAPGPASETALTFVLTESATTHLTPATYTFTGKPEGSSDNLFKDAGFEVPQLADGQSQPDPANAWTWANIVNEGVAHNGSGYTSANPNAPEGKQVAYIQYIGSVGQTIHVTKEGMYAVSFFAAQRVGNTSSQELQLYVNGTAVGGRVKPVGNTYAVYTTDSFHLVPGNHTITLKGEVAVGDNTALIDVVRLIKAPDTIIQDPGFEDPPLAANQFQHDPPGTAWVWANIVNEGIAHNGSGYTQGQNAPEGVQVAYIQFTGSVTQTVNLEAGSYEISFYAAQRLANTQPQTLNVRVDGEIVATITPTGNTYQLYTTPKFTRTAGSHTITFQGTNPLGGDSTALIDFVQVHKIPALLNGSPTATFASGAPTPQGSPATVSFTNQSDSPEDITAGFTYSYDFDNDGTFEIANSASASAVVPGSFLVSPGSHAIRGVITDQNGNSAEYTTAVVAVETTETVGIFNPANATWFFRNGNGAGGPDVNVFAYGFGGVIEVIGDWDGDGDDTIGIYNPANAMWYLRNSNAAGAPDITPFSYGFAGAIPVVGDWNGDGIDTIGIYNPANAMWYLRNSNAAGAPDITPFAYGFGNKPVVGDWNGDGIDTVGIYNPGNAMWFLRNSNSAGAPSITPFAYGFGANPVVGDWNGDGVDTVGIYNPGNAGWYLRDSNTAGAPTVPMFSYGFGNRPVVGNWLFDTLNLGSANGELVPSAAANLSAGDLEAIRTAALTRLENLIIDTVLLTRLQTVTFEINNLANGVLAQAFLTQNRVVVDANAAGHGWFVDGTPLDDAGGVPAGQMDLLTVVLRQLGHLAGRDSDDVNSSATDLMAALLGTGTRRTDMLDAVFAGQ